MPRKPKPDISEGDEVILRGRVTKVMDGDRPIFVVQVHHTMVDGRVQMSREGIERAEE